MVQPPRERRAAPDESDLTISERLLAHLLLDGMGLGVGIEERAARLSACGISNNDIGFLLRISKETVSQHLYNARKRASSSATVAKKKV